MSSPYAIAYSDPMHGHSQQQQGFVLVTGLIFLVMMTLLAVTSLSSNSLQERISSNFREKAQARDTAESALRDAEFLIFEQVLPPIPEESNTDAFWPAGAMTAGDPQDTDPFLDAGTWSQQAIIVPAELQAREYGEDTGAVDLPGRAGAVGDLPPPQYFIEDFAFDRSSSDLSPETAAKGIGLYMYRVTARAEGGSPASSAVLQSYYQKRFK